MHLLEVQEDLGLKALIALVALIATILFALALPGPAAAGNCHTTTQNISKRKGVSCHHAKRVIAKTHSHGVTIPECKSDPIARWGGWKFKAIDNLGIVVRATKGHRHFILSGGGSCA